MFLVIVDCYSRYVEIARLNQLTAEELITHTKSIFVRHGIPEEVMALSTFPKPMQISLRHTMLPVAPVFHRAMVSSGHCKELVAEEL